MVLRRSAGRTAPLARRSNRADAGGHRDLRDRRDRQNHPGRRNPTRVRDREPSWILVSLAGPLTLESLLGAVITTIRRELLISSQAQDTAEAIRALDVAGRANLDSQDRLAILRGHVLDHMPVLLMLDNFEDNRPGPFP